MTLDELEQFFSDKSGELQLNAWSKITDVKKFSENHIEILRNNPKNRLYLPYYERLIEAKDKIESVNL